MILWTCWGQSSKVYWGWFSKFYRGGFFRLRWKKFQTPLGIFYTPPGIIRLFQCWWQINSAWGEYYRLIHSYKSQLGRAIIIVLLCGDWKYLGDILQLNLPCTWWTEQLYSLDKSYLPLFLILPVIVFCFARKYSRAAINVKCIYQKWILDVLCKTKQKKEKTVWNFFENESYWFEVWPVNRRFCTRGWRPSKRTPPNNRIYTIYTICEKLGKTAMWIIPLGSNSAIAFMSSSISSLCCLVEGRSEWLVLSELDSRYRSPVARLSNET